MSVENSTIVFNPVPKIYDEISGEIYFESYAIETAKRVASLNPKSVLETACGTGRVTNHLRKNISADAKLVATDINPDMLGFAKEKFSSEKNIEWKLTDALNLPFENNSFDVVVCQFGAMFFPDKVKGFSEAFRVLKKNGTFIFSVWDKLEFNPLAAAGRKILNDFFEGNPPAILKVAFTMTDKKQIGVWLEEAGFSNFKFEAVRKECMAESAELLATAIVDGGSVRTEIHKKNPNAVPVIRKKIIESVVRNFGDHPVRSTMQAIVITAEKK